MSSVIAIDFESFFSSKLKYSLKRMVAEQYCRHHLFHPYLLSVCNGEQAWAGSPKDFNWECLEGATLVSHNAAFDRVVYQEMVRRNWAPQIQFESWNCSANLSAYLCNRRSLSDAVDFLFKVKLDKKVRSDANNKRWPEDFSAEEQAAMLKYAKDDALWCWKLWTEHSAKMPEHAKRLSNLMIEQATKGVQINPDLLETFIIQTHEMKLNTEKLLPWLADTEEDDDWGTPDPKPTSTKAIAEACRRAGIPAAPVKAHEGEEAYAEWEATYGPANPWISALSSWRSINKLYVTFMTVKERLRSDGTMSFGQKFMGSHTGRVSGESRVNLFNQRKQAVLCNENGLMEGNQKRIDDAHQAREEFGKWPTWVKYGIDFRNLITARPGMKLVASDSSQIEPRIAAWYVGDTEFLNLVGKGVSPYQAHAETTMGWTGGDLKKENPTKYKLAKARVLSLYFGAGWEKLIIMAQTLAGLDLTIGDPEWIEQTNPFTGEVKKVSGYGSVARKTVADFRESNPKIVAMWRRLDDALRASISDDFIVTLPSGRSLRYESVRAETRIEQDKETGKPRRRTVFTVCIGGKRVVTYGSKIFENIVQACAADVFYWQVLKLDDAGFPMLFGTYDEFVGECPPDRSLDEVKKIMSMTPPWIPGLPVACDAHELTCYTK